MYGKNTSTHTHTHTHIPSCRHTKLDFERVSIYTEKKIAQLMYTLETKM